jgi:DNA-binding CsgD family transcriptional regulator
MEREVVRLTQDGLTNAEIAARLGITTNTVKHYLAHAYEKLGAQRYGNPRTVAAVMLYCHEHETHAGRLLRTEER